MEYAMEHAQTKILTWKELDTEESRQERMKSMEGLKEDGAHTPESSAQSALMSYLMQLGGVREEVYQYLLTPRFKDTASVAAIRPLLCAAAPLPWIRLAVHAQEKKSSQIFINEIVTAFKEQIPVEAAEKFLKESGTPFEICQRRMNYRKPAEEKQTEIEALDCGGEVYSGEADIQTSETGEELRLENERLKTEIIRLKTKLYDSMTQSPKEKSAENPIPSQNGQPAFPDRRDQEMRAYIERMPDQESERRDRVTQSPWKDTSQAVTEQPPDIPDGAELLDSRILVMDLEQKEQEAGRRISFFSVLLARHMKKSFAKLDEETQVSRIFEIMVGRKYGKGKIMAIRRLLNGGMTKEFVFSLLEEDLPEKELVELSHILLDEEPGAVEDTAAWDEKAANAEKAAAPDENEGAAWKEGASRNGYREYEDGGTV